MLPDNYDLWEQHDAEQEALLAKLPRCCVCGEPVQQEDAVKTKDGFICDYCLEDLRTEVLPIW